MQEGSFRCDANVSVRRPGGPLGTRREIKNLNSFKFMQQAIDFEVRWQIEQIEDGHKIQQATVLFNPDTGETRAMRTKEDAADYRYFPDPDLPPLCIAPQWIEQVRSDSGKAVLVAPYLGHIGGLITLDALAVSRGGRLSAPEIAYAAEHLLTAFDAAHTQRVYNGPLDPALVLVDRGGRTHIELFGVARYCERGPVDATKVNEHELLAELTSVFELLFRVLTGLDRRSLGVRPGQAVAGLDPGLDAWFTKGLASAEGQSGFESAEHALAELRDLPKMRVTPVQRRG
jgi:hypothetical protein